MDEEMEIIPDLVLDDVDEEESFEEVFDPDYEFDARQFFDFCRDEAESESEEAERWFRYAREYPPSRLKHRNLFAQDIKKAKSKPAVKSCKLRSSTLMKPTASHLAKQSKGREVHSGGRGRLQKPLVKAFERLQSPPGGENLATKRQKLEIGYLRKVAHLKHLTSFMHKTAKKAAPLEASPNSKSKTTTPRKLVLVTEERAQRRRSQSKSEPGQQPKANTHAFKSRPLNRKTLATPSLAQQRKKSMPHLTEFQEFHLKTTERAMQHQSASVLNRHNSTSALQNELIALKRQNSGNAGKKQKHGSLRRSKSCAADKVYPMKEGGFMLNAKQDSDQPPVELFKKLSLKSESNTKTRSPSRPHRLSKASKENAPRSCQLEFWRCARKPNQCASEKRLAEVKFQPDVKRSVDIR